MKNSSTIFISGTGRSGTNITKAILAKHSQCATLPFEYRFTIDPGGIVDFINQYSGTWSPFMADKRLRELEKFLLSLAQRDQSTYNASTWLRKIDHNSKKITPYPYTGWELEKVFPGYKKHVKILMNQLIDYKYLASWPGSDMLSESNEMYFGKPKTKKEMIPIFSEFLNNCFQACLTKTKKEVFVEDNTWSLLYAEDLISLVPNGKIIHVIRDPRDVISSLMKQRWTPSDFDQLIIWYKSIMSIWKDEKSKLRDDQYLEIRLEDIIFNSEIVIQKVCGFVGLEYERTMSQINLSKSNSGRYKHELSIREITQLENSLAEILKEYNY